MKRFWSRVLFIELQSIADVVLRQLVGGRLISSPFNHWLHERIRKEGIGTPTSDTAGATKVLHTEYYGVLKK